MTNYIKSKNIFLHHDIKDEEEDIDVDVDNDGDNDVDNDVDNDDDNEDDDEDDVDKKVADCFKVIPVKIIQGCRHLKLQGEKLSCFLYPVPLKVHLYADQKEMPLYKKHLLRLLVPYLALSLHTPARISYLQLGFTSSR